MAQRPRFQHLLAWVLLLAAPSGQAASVFRARTAAAKRRAVAENILTGPNSQAQIITALQAHKVHTSEEGPHSLRLSLAELGLPVPPEVRDLAEKADGSKKVTPAEADSAKQRLNKMLEEQHWLLDHKVIDCREKRRSAGEAIQDAASDVRNLASETSSARSIIVEATSRIPQDRRSFEEFKVEAQMSRTRCSSAGISDKVRSKSLEHDAAVVSEVHDNLMKKCAGVATNLLQQPSEDVDDIIADAESTLQGGRAPHIEKQHMLSVECPAMAAALGVVARKRSGAAASFLQEMQPACKLSKHTCDAMLDISAEIAGEIADSQARLRASSARIREACKDEQLFAQNQLSMETSQVSDRSRELSEATFKAGEVGDLANEKDSLRQKLQANLKAITAKCTAEISGILYGKMCALQKVRDSLQILAGRTELPEDCQVTDWDEGMCSATCGGGKKTLTRKVLLTEKGGAACPSLTLNLECGESACPKDCEVSRWSGWSACSAACDGGVQERNRAITLTPVGNGVGCPHLVDMRLCNSEACTSECELLQWTPWSPCTKACEGGSQKRSRGLRDEGKASCPTTESKERVEFRECNKKECDGNNDVACAGAPMDVVLLLDASGSITQEGFNSLQELSLELVRHYSLAGNGTKLSVATFAKQAMAISSLTSDANQLSSRMKGPGGLQWLKGPGNAGAGLSRAASLLAAGGRKEATSLVLMVTDGRLVDPFLAQQAADRLKKNGIRLAFALVGTDYKNSALLKNMASTPEKDNVIRIPGFKQLPPFVKWAAKRIITGTCSAVI